MRTRTLKYIEAQPGDMIDDVARVARAKGVCFLHNGTLYRTTAYEPIATVDPDDLRRASHDQESSTVHMCPPDGQNTTPCCGRTPFELPKTDRMTLTEQYVTCDQGNDLPVGMQSAIGVSDRGTDSTTYDQE